MTDTTKTNDRFFYASEFDKRGACRLLAFVTDDDRQSYLFNNGYWGARRRSTPEPADRTDFSGTYAVVVDADGDCYGGEYAGKMVDPMTEEMVGEMDARLAMRQAGLLPRDYPI